MDTTKQKEVSIQVFIISRKQEVDDILMSEINKEESGEEEKSESEEKSAKNNNVSGACDNVIDYSVDLYLFIHTSAENAKDSSDSGSEDEIADRHVCLDFSVSSCFSVTWTNDFRKDR